LGLADGDAFWPNALDSKSVNKRKLSPNVFLFMSSKVFGLAGTLCHSLRRSQMHVDL
jgi:hypothetical protein